MADLAQRFSRNPLLMPMQVRPSQPGLKVECLLNPGVFRHEGHTYLLVRVAERSEPHPDCVRVPIMEDGQLKILGWASDDPALNISDPREYKYKGEGYLSTLSHLRFFVSDDGISFAPAEIPPLWGEGILETFGIEDCRVTTFEDGRFFLTYTAVSAWGYGVACRETSDWKTYRPQGMILSPSNKDAAIFDRKIGGRFACLHRPSGVIVGGHYIWLAFSHDLHHWGGHLPVARTRPDMWDSARIGAGAAPIYTPHGWLGIYHGADRNSRYCLGALLLDLKEPWKVLARSAEPIMEPLEEYEQKGFLGNVIFTNGHLLDGDKITLYYGASDSVICGATLSLSKILQTLSK
jgi:predicted GH43/DUF377 family glycosyl hydrolase